MNIALFLFKFFFCFICWTAVAAILGSMYNSLCTKFKRDYLTAPLCFMAGAGIGVVVGSIMAGFSAHDGFFAVAAVGAPATFIGCAIGGLVGLFFKEKPMPRRKGY